MSQLIPQYLKTPLRSAARKLWLWKSPERKLTVTNARQSRGIYLCEMCKTTTNKIEIDHIQPAGAFTTFAEFGSWLERLFCSETNLRALCRNCHLSVKQTNTKGKKLI